MSTCNTHVPAPTGSISVAVHNHLPFGVIGSQITPGHWAFGYYYVTGVISSPPEAERTPTVILATLTVTNADCGVGAGGGGTSCNVDISGSIPGHVDPYINGCYLVLVNMDTGEEGTVEGPFSFDGVIPLNLCGSGTYPGSGQPFGSFAHTDFNCGVIGSGGFRPLVGSDTSRRPDPPAPPPTYPRSSGGLSWTL